MIHQIEESLPNCHHSRTSHQYFKMKLSLLFLACCLMATYCFAQNIFYLPFYPSGGRAVAGHHWPHHSYYFRDPVGYYNQPGSIDYYDEELGEDVYAAGNKYQLKKRLPPIRQNVAEPAAKQLIRTVFTTAYGATTTITLSSVVSCVPAAQFIAGSTTACRRRRDVAQLLDNIQPTSNLDQIETTPAVGDGSVERIQRDIESSREALLDYIKNQDNEAGSRFGFGILNNLLLANIQSTSTITITIPTSYNFVATASTKVVNLGAAGAVSCLPAGLIVCP